MVKDDPERTVEPYSKEDMLAVKGPGMVQSMLQMDESDDESSDDNADALIKKLEKAGLKAADADQGKKSKVADE